MRYTLDDEVTCLQRYARGARLGIVEIGVLDGDTTREFGRVAHVPIYGIDPIVPDSMTDTLIGSESNIRSAMDFYPYFTFIKDYSYNVVKTWGQPFDFIFIDGSHVYEDVRRDFEDWFPKLAPGGFMAFHDVSERCWPGPLRLGNELKASGFPPFIEQVLATAVFQKPKEGESR